MSVPASGCSIQSIDFYGRTATRRYRFAATTYANMVTAVAAVLAAIQVLTDCAHLVTRAWVRVAYSGTEAAEGSNVDEGFTFAFDLGDARTAVFKVPAPVVDDTFVTTDGTLDLTQTEFVTFLDFFEGGAPRILLSDGEPVVAIISGRLDT